MRDSSGIRRVAAIAAAAASVTAGACGDGGGSGSDRLESGDDYSVAGAVAEIPLDLMGDDILISTGDLNAASEAGRLGRPESLGDVPRWTIELTNGGADSLVFVPLGEYAGAGLIAGQFEEFEDEIGYSILDVDAFVELSTPPETFVVVAGDLDDDSLSDDLEDLGDGLVSHGTAEDFTTDPEGRSAVSRVGFPVRLAADGGRIALSPSTPAVRAWLDGDEESASPSLEAIATSLDEADVYAAVLSEPESGFPASEALGPAPRSAVERLLEEDWIPPAAYRAVGVGWSVDDDEPVITVAVAHPDEDAARENAEAFELMFADGESLRSRRPLDELYDLQDVTVDGELVVLTLYLPSDVPPLVMYQALVQRDAPFIHA